MAQVESAQWAAAEPSSKPSPVNRASGLKIVHVVLTLDVGGLERNIVNQARVAPRFNQRMTIICLERPGALAPQARELEAEVLCLNKPAGFRPGIFFQLSSLLAKLRPDVVHSHQLSTLLYGGVAARRAGVPVVVHTEHGQEPYASHWRTRWLGRIAGRSADRFYCLTADMAANIDANRIVRSEQLRVIANGIDTSQYRRRAGLPCVRQKLGIPAAARVVGMIGRLSEIKRIDVLIRAFVRVRGQVPDAHLLIVGDGPQAQSLRDLAQSLDVAPAVHFAGYQSQTVPFLHAMDVFTLTSRSEGMPQAAIEACVAGVPVAATGVGGLPELIEHGRTGLLFPPGNVDAAAEAILTLLQHTELARSMANVGQARAESMFDIGRMAAEYQADYEELLNANAGRE